MQILDALAHLEKLRPGLSDSLEGADEEIVEKIQSVAGFTLPPDYVEFLELLGSSAGELAFVAEHGIFDCRAETALAVHTRKMKRRVATEGKILFIGEFVGTCQDCGPCALDRAGGPSRVVQYDGDKDTAEERRLLAPSLGQYLLICGFKQFALARYKTSVLLPDRKSTADLVERLRPNLEKRGFHELPYQLISGSRFFSSATETVVFPSAEDQILLGHTPQIFAFKEAAAKALASIIEEAMK